MKTAIIALASLVVLGITAIAGTLLVAKNAGDNYQDRFVSAIQTGDAALVHDLMDPELQKEIDVPVLQAWVTALNKQLGGYEGVALDSKSSYNYENGNVRIETEATLNFENGTAESHLVYMNDKIVSFDVVSNELGNWFAEGPASGSVYFERATQFIRNFTDGEMNAARKDMYPTLREEAASIERLESMRETLASTIGDIEKIEIIGGEFSEKENQNFHVQAHVDASEGSAEVSVNFVFNGMKGQILAFNFATNAELAID